MLLLLFLKRKVNVKGSDIFPQGIIPGYYMNKTHWNSIYLDADIPSSFVEELIEHSYQLVFKMNKKSQHNILQNDSKGSD